MIEELLLFKKVKEGDIGAFEKLFRKYHIPLGYYATSITRDSDAAEDIIQDLFYMIWKERETISVLTSVNGYLYRAVRNRALQYCEQKANANKYKESVSTISQDSAEFNELEKIVAESMSKMPSRRAEIFKMHRFHNIKYKEIANKLSVSVKTVEAEMSKALKTIRKEIDIHIHTL